MIGLGVLCTALAFVLFFELIAEVGPLRATVVTYLNPAVAVLAGVTVLGEPFTAGTAAGFVLILGGSWFATRSSARRAPGLRLATATREELPRPGLEDRGKAA